MANGKHNKKKRWIILTVVAVAVIALVVVAVAATRGGTKIDPTKLAKVEQGDLAKSVVATGKVTPITKVEIKSKASGIVKKLYVDAGDRVHTGQMLAELDQCCMSNLLSKPRQIALEAAGRPSPGRANPAARSVPWLLATLRPTAVPDVPGGDTDAHGAADDSVHRRLITALIGVISFQQSIATSCPADRRCVAGLPG